MLKIIDITTLSGQVTSSQLSSANAKLVHLKCLELRFFFTFWPVKRFVTNVCYWRVCWWSYLSFITLYKQLASHSASLPPRQVDRLLPHSPPWSIAIIPVSLSIARWVFFFFDDFSGVTLDPMTSAYKCISNLSLKNQLCANVGS